jgi:hypothetical protein
MEGSKRIYKYIFWYIRLFAIVSMVAALLLIVLGTLLDFNENANSYTFDAGLVLITISACLLAGTRAIRKHKAYGESLVTIGAVCFLIASAFPIYNMIQLMEGLSGPFFLAVIWLMMAIPFIFLIYFVWKHPYTSIKK